MSPLIIAACAAVPVVYIALPRVRLALLVMAALLFIGCIVLCVLKKHTKYTITGIAVLLGLIAGFCCVYRVTPFAPGIPAGEIASIKGILLDDPRSFSAASGQNALGSLGPEEERGMAAIKISQAGSRSGTVRASSRGRALVYFPAGTMPRLKEFGRGAELYIEGIFLPDESGAKTPAVSTPRFRAASVHIIKKAPALERMRTGIRGAILARLQPKAWGGLAAALLIGTRENLEGSLANSFRDAGLSHILALSGMHLAFISAMLAIVLKKPLGKKGSVLAGLVFIVAYVFLVGPAPSLVRAVIMYGLGSFLMLSGTEKQMPAVLSAAFLVQVLWDPASAYSVSFILSYLALAGILLLSAPVQVLLRGRLPPSLAQGISASSGAFLVTSPAVSFFFGILRPAGLIASLIAAPLAGVFMALSLLWLFLGKLPLVGRIIALFLDKLLTALQFCMQWFIFLFARFPGMALPFPLVCVCAPLLIVLLAAVSRREECYRNGFIRFAA